MQLAQVNVAEAVAPLDSPALRGFVRLLDPLDALARESPGFVWRPRPEELDPDELAAFGDPWWIVVNLSVWESVAALRGFTYGGAHGDAVRRRRQWFHRAGEPATALWWVEDGQRPTLTEARGRLELLRRHGPTAAAFPLHQIFPP